MEGKIPLNMHSTLLRDGVDLNGQVPRSGGFPPCFKPAELSPLQLQEIAPSVSASALEAAMHPPEHNSIIAEKIEAEELKS